MNTLDGVLLVLLVPFALRGFFRGFCRESFGLAGLVGGVVIGVVGAPTVAPGLIARGLVDDRIATPAAFALLFVVTVVAAHVIGILADRVLRAILLGGMNRVAGLVVGTLKGATLLGFGLLIAERAAPTPALTKALAGSTLAHPLVRLAAAVFETGRGLAVATESHA